MKPCVGIYTYTWLKILPSVLGYLLPIYLTISRIYLMVTNR
jgi:hypothetical protein